MFFNILATGCHLLLQTQFELLLKSHIRKSIWTMFCVAFSRERALKEGGVEGLGFFPLSYSLNPNRAVEADYLKCTFKKNLLVTFTVFGFAAVVHLDQVSHDKQVFFT